MKNVVKVVSGQILDFWIMLCERRKTAYFSRRMEKELGGLNPGINLKTLIQNYYREKIETGLKILVVGGMVVLLCIYNAIANGDLKDDNYLERKEAGGGKQTIILDARVGEVKVNDVLIEVDEKELSDDEIKKELEAVKEALPDCIIGKNESLQYVNQPLELINTWKDTGISILWSSSNYGILQEDGTFGEDAVPQEGIEVILTALILWNEIQLEERIPVMVYPIEYTEEEMLRSRLLDMVEDGQTESRSEDYLELPRVLDNEKIIWTEQKTSTVIKILGLIIVTALGIYWGKDQELHKQYEARNRRLALEYSEFVSKLQLLISSGMSTRGAFIHLGREYQKNKKRGGSKKYAYEELLVVVRKMENGMSEIDAYNYFGKRCDLISYKKLAAILIQNVKRGTEGFKDSLLAETKNAFEERKQEAKRMGEEAGTKLLFPMMMMMAVVLIIIVVPAYFSFGGI